MGAEIAKVARVVATKTAESRPSASERSSLLHRCCHLTDEINDKINDEINDLGLSIIRTVKSNPGIKADKIYEILSAGDKGITLNMVRNSIRRELGKYIELRGSRKTGGYYLKYVSDNAGE